MEMHDRIKMIRKNNNLSQNEFAERLGVTRSVISNIELNRLAKPEQKISLIKLISKEFNVNEEWLLNGVGEITPIPDTFVLEEYAKSKGATDFEVTLIQKFIKNYFDLPETIRDVLISSFKETVEIEHFEPKIKNPNIEQFDNLVFSTKVEHDNVSIEIQQELDNYKQELKASHDKKTSLVSDKKKNA